MVKVVERDPEDLKNEDKTGKLPSILNKNFGTRFSVNRDFSPSWFAVRDRRAERNVSLAFHIYPTNNRIDVYSEKYLEDAVELATLYEKSGEQEFTVRKTYGCSAGYFE